MKTRNITLLLGGSVILLLAFLLWGFRGLDNELKAISTIIGSNAAFKNLHATRMKPGYNKIVGTVPTTNDLALLHEELKRAQIRNCAVLVNVPAD